MIEPTLELPITDQCRLLELARSTYYYNSTIMACSSSMKHQNALLEY
jgi:ACT domain-containing protein